MDRDDKTFYFREKEKLINWIYREEIHKLFVLSKLDELSSKFFGVPKFEEANIFALTILQNLIRRAPKRHV